MSSQKLFWPSFIAWTLAAICVTATSSYVCWDEHSDPQVLRTLTTLTQRTLESLEKSVNEYRQQFGTYPKSLAEIRRARLNNALDGESQLKDGWGHPIQWTSDNNGWLATSLGRDNQPGGVGLDADMTSENWRTVDTRPTFGQWLRYGGGFGMLLGCGLAGVCTFGIGAYQVRRPPNIRPQWLIVLIEIVFTAGVAMLFAVIISVMHIPNGH